jgi:AraC-like DNA-binding protein/quercetin dioxygenase-like cupin family protein
MSQSRQSLTERRGEPRTQRSGAPVDASADATADAPVDASPDIRSDASVEASTDPSAVATASAPVVSSGDESNAVSGVAADFEHAHRLAGHRHRRAQLVYAVEGVMTVETDAGLWVVPPLRALWVPAGVVHSIRMTGHVAMRTVYFDPSLLAHARTPERCAVLGVSPLLRELVVRIVHCDAAGETIDPARRLRMVELVFDELRESPVNPLEVPMPGDSRLRRIADAVVADPADNRDLAGWASFAGIGERTLARLFPQETGMTFVRWRQQVRLLGALERLGSGQPVTTVALEMGYTSTSAFVKLFRESLGVTPGRYFADNAASAVDAAASSRD